MPTIDVGKEFYHRLANRDQNQGDGKYTAIEFRKKFLATLDNETVWNEATEPIIFDFGMVKKIGPSFAYEAFGYFTRYTKPDKILLKIQFKNISDVQRMIIKQELESGYTGK